MLGNGPRAIGKEFVIWALVDTDVAGDIVTQRSRTDFVAYLNGAPIFSF